MKNGYPDDVWAAAVRAVPHNTMNIGAVLRFVANAIVAERERCTKIAECDCFDVCGESPGHPRCGMEIAAEIRGKESGEPSSLSGHAITSPGPVNCSIRRRHQDLPYPRTCERCGLGPCPFFHDDGNAK